jgi:RHH-type proline utilization regulon transcriptional repressor/proline dehydrogenase/delta 1-pyrroline-5-carboxylate dehydrogenase
MRPTDAGRPEQRAEPGAGTQALLKIVRSVVEDDGALQTLIDAAGSDAYWMTHQFGIERDEAGLFCERNVLRYRVFPDMVIRVGLGATTYELARALLALCALGASAEVSVDPGAETAGMKALLRHGGADGIRVLREVPDEFRARAARRGCGRIRLLGSEGGLDELAPTVYVDARPTVVSGRVELLRYLREQSVSITLHRFGSPVDNG